MKRWKKVSVIALALLMVIMLLPLGSFKAQAEEGEDIEVLGYKVGDIIKFGHYEQDGNTANGKEEIEWQVLKVESDRVLVISKYALDCKPYNTELTSVTWETCSLRKWLNNEFKNVAFTATEQAEIPTVNIANKNNPKDGAAGGNNTNDQIFCLSLEEMELYFGNYSYYDSKNIYGYNQNLLCTPTKYAENNGVHGITITQGDYKSYTNLKEKGYTSDVIGRRVSWWWLRSPSHIGNEACAVEKFGLAGAGFGYRVDGKGYIDEVLRSFVAVRPALYISIPKVNPTSIKLDRTSATMYYGNEMTVTATLTPSDVTVTTINWTSSNPAVATVSNGVVKAKSAGKTSITAKTVNGLTATCDITVFADNVPGNIFADIKADSWMYAPAKSVYDKGYMTGTGTLDGRVLFSPNTDMNRTMFVQALYSMDGKPAVTYVQKFSDVKESAWYAKAVTWASNNGIVAGNPDGTFGINGKATREQLALMFYKYAVSKGFNVDIKPSTTLDGFADANKVDSWALTAVKWAVERGIISGKGNASAGYRIAPTEKATRVECAAMMNKFSEIYANAPKLGEEDLEEPLALPEEEIEDLPVPADETEDVIIDEEEEDEDVPSEDEKETDEAESDSEEEAEVDTEECN